MNIQFVRLEHDVCERVNDLARERRETVSDLVNRILREHLSVVEPADAKPAK